MDTNATHVTMLRSAKLRATPIRLAIVGLLHKVHKPLSVEEIHKKTKEADLVTIYRTLESFEKAGLAGRVNVADGSVRFERTRPHHHHLVCTNCGTVEDIAGRVLKEVERSIQKVSRQFKSIYAHDLEFLGMCRSCIN